jgi:ADP-ribosylglycohydrolase
MPADRARFRGCLLGLATGDAIGTTVEFRPRGSFLRWWTSSAVVRSDSRRANGPTIRRWRSAYFAGSTHPESAGNGCIMRLAPVPMSYLFDEAAARGYAADSSRTTHGADECVDACRLLAWGRCRHDRRGLRSTGRRVLWRGGHPAAMARDARQEDGDCGARRPSMVEGLERRTAGAAINDPV